MATACIYQPNFIEINVSDGPLDMIRKKRKLQQPQQDPSPRESKRQPQFSIRKIKHSYILSLYKEITFQLVAEIIKKKISKIWGKVYIPSYELVSDSNGNQVYVEQDVNEDKLSSEIMMRLNPNQIDLEATQELFDDYHLELTHLANGISISSSNDRFHKEFSFNNTIDGKFRIRGTSVSADSLGKVYGIMQIEIPFNGDSLRNECTVSGYSAYQSQTDEPNDIEQEIRAFNISRDKQEGIIKEEVSRRLKA
ncbi:hypothetical protein SMKI_16G3080 [Saccharomyces mikatae IFO 1815]|uniref:Uncharacterized protein n=1 Tax=Saccharomyces mikatae IFO 1815 TaxID=226126 RepID=A0AA35IVQ7_SACMI|nr:uncharacterized protein SMKI_16G3080 [Saccharomyces mikatae IFO 1815]CAI4037010.1 hypothetical protein SMKI_16G3080 [Saccharomyces mikatae IFO 1815]